MNGIVWNEVYVEFSNFAVGATCVAPLGQHAATWTSSGGQSKLTDLGTLPGSHPDTGGDFSVATDYNTAGDIVGTSQSAYFTNNIGNPYVADHGFIYNNGQWTDLIPIAGPNYFSSASGVNASREVVGSTNTISSVTGETLNRAFIYIDGKMYNLTFYLVGGPTVLLTNATGIDCQGNIGATGTPAGSVYVHDYLLVRQGPARTSCPK
jgi:probable HAF family extracellular repeat protein